MAMNPTEKPAIIRLPPTTKERKARYMRASGARKMKLTVWIWESLDAASNPNFHGLTPESLRNWAGTKEHFKKLSPEDYRIINSIQDRRAKRNHSANHSE